MSATNQQHFNVENIRCARCIHAIESALSAEPDITSARVNMSTNRLSIAWDGPAERVEDFTQKVISLGYPVTPYEAPKSDMSESKKLLRCMAIAGFAMGNLMLISVSLWSSGDAMGIATRDLLHWISAAIALPAIAYSGRPFFSSARSVLRHGRTNMDVPISLALILACAMSLFETLNHGAHIYFDSAVMLLFFLLIGRWLDARARGKARENAETLLAMMQGYATVIDGASHRTLPIAELQEGMRISIAMGEKVPTDCVIESGTSELDTSLVTGETVPRAVHEGETIFGGTINLSAPLTCRILKASEDSLLADIIRLMENAEQGRARYVRLADKAAKLYTPLVHSLALFAFLGWVILGGASWQEALLIAITTLIITCPCALGLAVPVVQVLATSWLMKRGILVKSGDALERLAKVTRAMFDKTGTLTLGKPTLDSSAIKEQDLRIAASLAAQSKHPYSIAVSNAYQGALLDVSNAEEIPAVGIRGIVNGKPYQLGKPLSDTTHQETTPHIYLSTQSEEPITFPMHDPLRGDAKTVIAALNTIMPTTLLSGDVNIVAQHVGGTLSMSESLGGLSPAEKTQHIEQAQRHGDAILMVGDGLNDAPSLAQADVSISPASGMDITQNTADIVFQGAQLAPVLSALKMGKFSTALVKQNFTLAVAYNCIAIPLAVAGYVTPLIAAIAMSGSSLLVIANSFRIMRMKG